MFLFRVESLEYKVLINQLFYLRTYSVPFVPHHDDSVCRQFLCVHVFSVEECTEQRNLSCRLGFQVVFQFRVMDFYMCQCAHCGLHSLRTEDICGVGAANDMFDAEPVGKAYDGSEISRVLYAV